MSAPESPKDGLIPPDYERCQCERREGSFMTLGPRSYVRCDAVPVFLAVEVVAGADGRHGAMSLCLECAKVMLDRPDLRARVQLQPIAQGRHSTPSGHAVGCVEHPPGYAQACSCGAGAQGGAA